MEIGAKEYNFEIEGEPDIKVVARRFDKPVQGFTNCFIVTQWVTSVPINTDDKDAETILQRLELGDADCITFLKDLLKWRGFTYES